MKNLTMKLSGFLAAGLLAIAATTVSAASVWIFAYQPKTPKSLIKKSL